VGFRWDSCMGPRALVLWAVFGEGCRTPHPHTTPPPPHHPPPTHTHPPTHTPTPLPPHILPTPVAPLLLDTSPSSLLPPPTHTPSTFPPPRFALLPPHPAPCRPKNLRHGGAAAAGVRTLQRQAHAGVRGRGARASAGGPSRRGHPGQRRPVCHPLVLRGGGAHTGQRGDPAHAHRRVPGGRLCAPRLQRQGPPAVPLRCGAHEPQ
jgi:hypothetical protein